MSRIFVGSVLAVLLLINSPAARAANVEQQIIALEDAVNKAYAENDLPHYFAYYAPDLRALYPEGPTNLPDYVKSWTQFVKDGGKIEHFTTRDMKIQVSPSGDAAVASYQASVTTLNPGKKPEDENFNETDVWFNRDGAWKIVEIHYSTIEAAK
jgi:ketosteroid isomerase-like protein